MKTIYFDNAATSWPKPEDTLVAMNLYSQSIGASPGRSGHRLSIEAGRVVFETRDALAQLFGIHDPLRIVFTKNATEALNIAISGLLKPGDHAITSSMEHNSVMRPLRSLEDKGLELSIIPCSGQGDLNPDDIVPHIQKNTRAVILTHASNVTGTILPVADVGKIAREHGLIFCVDAAQTAGAIPIDVDEMLIDLLAFTGHKSLFGPQGTGGLYIRNGLEKVIAPVMTGGTGSKSEFEEQPDFMPDKYESGTLNTIGLAGLGAGVRYILSQGIDAIRASEEVLTTAFLRGVQSMDGVILYGHRNASRRIAVVSFNIRDMSPSEVALALDERYHIMSRPGLHCAPSAHKTIGTFPAGTNRFSFGYFNTVDQVQSAIEAIHQLISGKGSYARNH
ncbi:MAG: aminotransferase class V-fold PLP-dependent enzyme [Deltaproteobacteria bacterium]|nr:aminotransferase class V-fold PLP-dependent enzyme [Deltaproteobacteria bacterium]